MEATAGAALPPREEGVGSSGPHLSPYIQLCLRQPRPRTFSSYNQHTSLFCELVRVFLDQVIFEKSLQRPTEGTSWLGTDSWQPLLGCLERA